jgi:hypothetical protein
MDALSPGALPLDASRGSSASRSAAAPEALEARGLAWLHPRGPA